MKIMNKILLLVAVFCCSVVTFADVNSVDEQAQAQGYLHNYGIAYCLSHAKSYKEEAGIAMGGYLQLGAHGQFEYRKVKEFVDAQLKQGVGGYQYSDLPAYLMSCLNISQMPEYQVLIEQLRVPKHGDYFLEE